MTFGNLSTDLVLVSVCRYTDLFSLATFSTSSFCHRIPMFIFSLPSSLSFFPSYFHQITPFIMLILHYFILHFSLSLRFNPSLFFSCSKLEVTICQPFTISLPLFLPLKHSNKDHEPQHRLRYICSWQGIRVIFVQSPRGSWCV